MHELERKNFSEIGLGTWKIGGTGSPDTSNDKEHIESIRYAMSRGINFFDTAEMYGMGHAEEILGNALKGNKRDNFFVTTKAWPSSFRNLETAIRNSLERLAMDFVDLYLIHWPDEKYNHETLIKDMLSLKEKGYTKHIGVSNYDLDLLKEAWDFSGGQIYANQIEVNVDKVKEFNSIRDFCKEKGIMIIAYTPLNRNHMPSSERMKKNVQNSGLTPAQYSLVYTLSLGTYPIPKATSKVHLDMLLDAVQMYREGKVKLF